MIWEGMHLCTEAVKVVILSINLIFEKMEALKQCEIVSSCEKTKVQRRRKSCLPLTHGILLLWQHPWMNESKFVGRKNVSKSGKPDRLSDVSPYLNMTWKQKTLNTS